MLKKIRFIVNPVSGVGRQKRVAELIKQFIDAAIFDYEIAYTKAPGHAIELSLEAAQQNYFLVVAVGGDGSVSEVAKGLINSDTAMGIIPTGSGNGLANHFKIPSHIPSALEVINKGAIIKIDTLKVNGEACVGIAGVGFDAHIAHEFANFGRRGFWSYCRIVIRESLKFTTNNYEINIDGNILQRKAFLVTFANSSQYGNNAIIAPEADIQDGYMDVCILKKISFLNIPFLIYRLFTGTIHRSHSLEIIRGRSASIKNNTNGLAHIDGDPKVLGQNIEVTLNPLSLKILIP